jgi:hypothetical protein
MRRLAAALFSVSLVALFVACATAPVDGDLGAGTSNATPSDSADKTLPPSNPPQEKDSGSSTPKDSGTSTPKDSGTSTPVDSGSGGTNTKQCDISDPILVALYNIKLALQSSPVTCPCNTGECCYLLFCVAE